MRGLGRNDMAGRKEHPGRAWPRSGHKAREVEAGMTREEK